MEPGKRAATRVLFIHGLESSPRGHKARYLEARFESLTPAMETGDFLGCLAVQEAAIATHQPELVIGSSFGGAVLLQLIQRGVWRGPSLFLAQAARRLDPEASLPPDLPVLLVHGLRDEVVPVEHSRGLAQTSPLAQLIELDDEHRLLSLTRSEALAELVHEAIALHGARR